MKNLERNEIEALTRMVLASMQKERDRGDGFLVPVGVSARHIHLTQEDVETLFGAGYQLTKKKELMGGQFAANECCTIVGLKLRAIENVRVLGPVRSATQVEISTTDARKLGSAFRYANPGTLRHLRQSRSWDLRERFTVRKAVLLRQGISICRQRMPQPAASATEIV